MASSLAGRLQCPAMGLPNTPRGSVHKVHEYGRLRRLHRVLARFAECTPRLA
jgi:hypothetical protein